MKTLYVYFRWNFGPGPGLTREWSGLSGQNLTWNSARLQSQSSNDCSQNYSWRYAVQGCENIAHSWNEQFKFAPPRTRVTAARLAVELFSPVHSNGVRGARRWYGCERLGNYLAYTHTHTHAHICYIYGISTHMGTSAGQTHTLSYSFGPYDMRGLRKMHYKFYCVEGVNLYN
jgi:hypothetical protein